MELCQNTQYRVLLISKWFKSGDLNQQGIRLEPTGGFVGVQDFEPPVFDGDIKC